MNVHSYLQVLDQLLMAQYLGQEETAQLHADYLRTLVNPHAPRQPVQCCGAIAGPVEGSRTVPHCRRKQGHRPANQHLYWGGFGAYSWTA